jgi:hypothetical protein
VLPGQCLRQEVQSDTPPESCLPRDSASQVRLASRSPASALLPTQTFGTIGSWAKFCSRSKRTVFVGNSHCRSACRAAVSALARPNNRAAVDGPSHQSAASQDFLEFNPRSSRFAPAPVDHQRQHWNSSQPDRLRTVRVGSGEPVWGTSWAPPGFGRPSHRRG